MIHSSSKIGNKSVDRYIRGVLSGKIVVGKWVRLAVERHVRDLKEAPARGLYFSAKAAQHAIDFFSYLRHSKGEWARRRFELSDWQQFLLWVLFGWRRADGTRRFRTAYVEVARKNGKSTLLAGIGLYLFFADAEPGAEVYTAATKRDQARIVHSEAVRMVRSSPALRKRIKVYKDNLNVEKTASKFEPLGADNDTMDGLNVHGAIIDELHAHKTSGVWDVLETATGARRQPLQIAITTAGSNRQSVCWKQHEYGEKILEGAIPAEKSDTYFVFIATIDKDDDWRDPGCWVKANPNLGISVKRDDLQRKADKAAEMPESQNAFMRLHLNVWTQQDVRWISVEKWNACKGSTLDASILGKRCYAGLDLAATIDIASACFTWPLPESRYLSRWRFWIPEDNIAEAERRDRVPYRLWIKQGWLKATPGNVIDYDVIRADLNAASEVYDIAQVALDRWNATQLSTQLQGDGFDVVLFGQGYASMSGPTKELGKLIVGQQMEHGGDPIAAWMASNVAVEIDAAGNIKPSKKKSTEKIDGIVAQIMSLGIAMASSKKTSVYQQRGIQCI